MAPINPLCLLQAAIHCKIKTYRGSAADSRVVTDRLAALTKDLEEEEVLDSEMMEEERMELNTYARRY